MATMQTFSATGEDAISRPVDIASESTPEPGSSQFYTYYEIDRTVRLIEEGNYKRIALQFPDELLHDSVPVYQALQPRLGPERDAYVLADTSYGSCCVDEVAASHVEADALVHYGHACLSQTSRLPVIYVFGRKELDIDSCVEKIAAYVMLKADESTHFNALELKHDVAFTHISNDIVSRLRLALGDHCSVMHVPRPDYTFPVPATSSIEHSKLPPPVKSEIVPCEHKIIVWIGEESPTLTKLLMTSSGKDIISFSPSSGILQPQSYLTNKLLMRRYALLQKARDADVFGILIGTLGVASYLPLIAHIRTQLKKARKKSYTVSVGKINPSKLANFMEIECWIWVACSEAMVDSKGYLRPIITPYELEIALQPEPEWTGKYVLDFQELLANAKLDSQCRDETGKNKDTTNDDELDPDQPVFSLVTGTYRHAKRYGNDSSNTKDATESPTQSGHLMPRSKENALAKMSDSAAIQYLHSRSYQGLDPRLGQDAPSVLEQGRSGVARGYADDHPDK
ncbi:hypothetical protein EW145_g4460 [Phellinidium pouzarii]|uniref:2-(3-amino-3-carboxypropyl)histidine synthase subunit 2 n=1 Tax=Phellinidium pouzarii TaxID=167371 RepID=A0A4S4L3X1_9AGAM|nr:hypothetical protein EW145_g4460 [Phellinidium pouzarii]